MSGFLKLPLLAGACLLLAACSNPGGAPAADTAVPAASSAAAPAASAIALQAPTSGAAATAAIVAPTNGPALSTIMQRPSFQQTFAAMDGAATLPAWTKTGGGTDTLSSKVQLDGQTVWLAHACKTAACPDGQLYLLVNPAAHTMQGLFLQASGTARASVQKLTWLGKPDAATQAYLKDQVAHG